MFTPAKILSQCLNPSPPNDQPLIFFNWAVQRMLRQKSDFAIPEGFLSVMLDMDSSIEEILDTQTNKDFPRQKTIVADILCKTSDDKIILIEVQFSMETDYFHRIYYGTARVMTDRLTMGQRFENIAKIYSIHVVYFPLGQGDDYLYRSRFEFVGVHHGDVLAL
ncbi:PD-(D/E)XK nuclease family transposase [Schleiferia thermophila]|uniref:Putative transposase/invertase (TIGR01784 family) n=1 Tax=Schleiferia thermophila TaxID=884107 RepID=A0A369A656_9FLAO|nr:PD-(D/E)XK nuclease family transposase [Schleiferia thermophila]RCX03557.1 putative transposase/invertase (TIGR01784 family) [Schleiferia thermophila]GCD79794.1 hypothetical protein JCM30197_10410 [Schleiferia thermophila]